MALDPDKAYTSHFCQIPFTNHLDGRLICRLTAEIVNEPHRANTKAANELVDSLNPCETCPINWLGGVAARQVIQTGADNSNKPE